MTRTLKALGASAATAGLLAVAGCSSEEEQASPAPDTAGESTGTTDTAESTAQDGGAESPASETPFDHDFATLLAGVTYKDQQVNQDTAEDVEVFKQITEAGAAEAENLGIVVDPPECAEAAQQGQGSFDTTKISPDTLTIGTALVDDMNVIAYDKSISEAPLANATAQLEQCSAMTVEVAGITQNVTTEQRPFEADASDGYAMVQTTESGDGAPLQVYTTVAEKNGVIVTIGVSTADEASIQAVNDTLDMILERV